MSFDSLHHILNQLQKQPSWQLQANYFQVLHESWEKVVGKTAFPHTRLLYVQRDTLWVAVSSAVWAQTLTLQRRQILKKLNDLLSTPHLLSTPLVDIHFSTAQWSNIPDPSPPDSIVVEDDLPLPLPDTDHLDPQEKSLTPHQAFERWKKKVIQRSQSFPLCPDCGCHTPPRELKLWQVCAICATKQWQDDPQSG
jgi:predicted nucleic acid-binding Zn ribbon protein